MSFKNSQDLVSSNALDLSNTMRVTKNYTDLRRRQTLLREFADVFFNLMNTDNTHSRTVRSDQSKSQLKH